MNPSSPSPALNPRDLFLEALEKSAPLERAAFLDGACRGDAAMRGAVEELLANHHEDSFLEEPAISISTVMNAPAEQPGERIGRYRLLQQIGEGGFGTVWMAEQMEPVSRRVALKIIKLGLDTREVIARFEAERQALAMMDHPNIAKVLDAGATGQGRPFFVMELVKGMPITQFCDEKQLGTRERLLLFEDVCAAINHAHQKGVIHRDIKPSNVMVTLHGDKAVPKVIDFGIAKATQGKLTDKTLFTRFEQFIGTPVYMSPEQAALSGLDIDTRSDIYALGILLYELLTGKPPFDAKSLASAGYEEMRRIIREVDPPKPSSRLGTTIGEERTTLAKARHIEPGQLSRAVESDLDWIVMKAMEKDRSRRYETANGLAADIQRFLDDEPVSARAPSARYKFSKFARRNRVALRVAVGGAVVLVTATAVSTWQAFRATKAEKLAFDRLAEVAAERDAKDQARKDAEAISAFLGEVFQSPDPTRDGRTIKVAELLDTAAKRLDTDLVNQPRRRATLQSTLAVTYEALGLYRQAIPLQEKVRDYYLATCGPEHPDSLQAMNILAISYRGAGRRDEAFKLAEELLTLSRKVNGPEHADTLLAMNNLAVLHDEAGRPDEALKLQEEVLTLSRKVIGPEGSATLAAMGNLAVSYFRTGRRDQALVMREQVLAAMKRAQGAEHPDTLAAMVNLATSYAGATRHEEAVTLLTEVLALSRKVNGPEHPSTLLASSNLANFYDDSNRGDDALKLREELLPLSRSTLGPEHPETLSAMSSLANSYAHAGRKDEALKLREDALPVHRRVLGPEHPETLAAMTNLTGSLSDAGRLDEAIELQEQSLVIKRRVLPPEHPYLMVALGRMATLYENAGRRDEALKLREDVQAFSGKVKGPEHPETLAAVQRLANSYYDANRKDEALKLREEVLPICRKVLGPEHPETLAAMTNLAISLGQADRQAEAIELQEQSLAIKRRVLPPEHPYLMVALGRLGELYRNAERKDEALKLREEALALRRKVDGQDHPHTRWAMGQLGDSYLAVGRTREALQLLTESSTRKPTDTVLALNRAMTLFKQGRHAEARELLTATEAKMKPLPTDEKNILPDEQFHNDPLILWLTYKEAKALLSVPPAR